MEIEKFDVNFYLLAKSLHGLNLNQTNLIAALDYEANPTLMDLARLLEESLKTAVKAILERMEPVDQKVLLLLCQLIDTTPKDDQEAGPSTQLEKVKQSSDATPSGSTHNDKNTGDDQKIKLFAIPLAGKYLNCITAPLLFPLKISVETLVEKGKYSVAIKHCEDTVSVIRKVTKKNNSLIESTVLSILASVHSCIDNHKEALDIFTDVLKIRQKKLGEDDLSVAAVLNNLGQIHSKCENYEEANSLCEKSYEIYSKCTKGYLFPDLAKQNYNLAALYQNMGNYAKAISHYQQVVNSCVYGPKELYVRGSDNLATCYRKQRKSKEVGALESSSSDKIEK